MSTTRIKSYIRVLMVLVLSGIATAVGGQVNAPNVQAMETTDSGLKTTSFVTAAGKVDVNFPDDMAANDEISGTVIAQPAGNTEEERELNLDELNGYVVNVAPDRPTDSVAQQPPESSSNSQPPTDAIGTPATVSGAPPADSCAAPPLAQVPIVYPTSPSNMPSFNFRVPPGCGRMRVGLQKTHGRTVCMATTPCLPEPPPTPCSSQQCILPTVGRCGYPIPIKRPCSGGFSNSQVQMQPPGGKPTNCTPLAKSPRQLVVKSPRSVIGPAQLTAREGNQVAQGDFHNLKVSLQCSNTVLHKGDSTQIQIHVQGLQGLKQPVKLHVHAFGVLELNGGNDQMFSLSSK